MTVENNNGVENPATHEIYQVEYHIGFSGENSERLNGSFQFEGSLPTREQVLSNITGQAPNADWTGATGGSYTVSRLMNNNVHIVVEQGNFSPDDLTTTTSA